jgi:hypothetical protein
VLFGVRAVVLGFVLVAGCQEETVAVADAGLPDAGAAVVEQGGEPTEALAINEVAPAPLEGADWVELVNRSGAPLDLCDFFLTDGADRLDHYLPLGGTAPPEPCAPRPLAAGEHLVVYAGNGDAPAGADRAPFGLGPGDSVHLVSTRGVVVDGLLYLAVGAGPGESLARQPSGEGRFRFAPPSRGVANPEEEP